MFQILVVEDDTNARKLMKAVLQRAREAGVRILAAMMNRLAVAR